MRIYFYLSIASGVWKVNVEEACERAVDGYAACRDGRGARVPLNDVIDPRCGGVAFAVFAPRLFTIPTSPFMSQYDFYSFYEIFYTIKLWPHYEEHTKPPVKFFVNINGLISHTQCINWYDNFNVLRYALEYHIWTNWHHQFTLKRYPHCLSLNIHNYMLVFLTKHCYRITDT